MKKYLTIRFLLSRSNVNELLDRKSNLTADSHLVVLLNNAEISQKYHDYIRAYEYAKAKSIMGIFHQIIPFHAKLILKVLPKHKSTKLPRTLLRLPIFNKETPVYQIKFLGSLVIYKNQKYLKVKLKPKDTAFLIYLTSRIAEERKSAKIDGIYANFWPRSRHPGRNLSHLLVRIKKALL